MMSIECGVVSLVVSTHILFFILGVLIGVVEIFVRKILSKEE